MNVALPIILLLLAVGWLLFERQKAKNQEALAQNDKTKEQLKEIDKDIASNDAAMKAEQDKLKEDEKKDVSKDVLLDYLNNPNK